MDSQRIDIIGAGISGLATAYYLGQALQQAARPVEIHVWEKDDTPGGLAGSFSTDDYTVEKFYHHLYRHDHALQDLIVEVGLGDDLIWRPAATGAYYFRRPYRLSSPLDLLRLKPLSLINRFRLGWLALHAKTIRDWRPLDDVSVKDYICRVAGEEVYHVVWEPLFHGKFGHYADDVSAAWLWSKLVDRGGSRNSQGHELLGYLRGGLGRLFEQLVAWLEAHGHYVHLGQAMQRLEGTQDRIDTLVTDTGSFPADLVIGCAQTPDLAAILPEDAIDYRTSLNDIHFLANVCLILTLKRSLSDFYWTNVMDVNAPFVGIIEQTKWVNIEDFNQKHLVYISAYVTHDDPRLEMDSKQLIDYYLPSVRDLFPNFMTPLIESHLVWKAPYAQPIVHVGYRHSIPAIESPIANFFVCTMAQIYPHDRQVSNGVALAQKTAEIVRQCC